MAMGSSTGANTLPTAIARLALLAVTMSDRCRADSASPAALSCRRFMRDTLAVWITERRAHPPEARCVPDRTTPRGWPGGGWRVADARMSGKVSTLLGVTVIAGRVALDAAAVVRCRRRVHLDHDPAAVGAPRARPDPALEQRQADSVSHRAEVGARLATEFGDRWRAIPPGPASAREQATSAAMAAGVPYIWNAVLPLDLVGARRGEVDLLVRAEDGGYQPLIVVRHRVTDPGSGALTSPFTLPKAELAAPDPARRPRSQTRDQLRLAHLTRMLQATGQAAGTALGGVIGMDADVVLWHDLAADSWPGGRSTLEEYDSRFADRLAVAGAAGSRGAHGGRAGRAGSAGGGAGRAARHAVRRRGGAGQGLAAGPAGGPQGGRGAGRAGRRRGRCGHGELRRVGRVPVGLPAQHARRRAPGRGARRGHRLPRVRHLAAAAHRRRGALVRRVLGLAEPAARPVRPAGPELCRVLLQRAGGEPLAARFGRPVRRPPRDTRPGRGARVHQLQPLGGPVRGGQRVVPVRARQGAQADRAGRRLQLAGSGGRRGELDALVPGRGRHGRRPAGRRPARAAAALQRR